MGLTQVRLEKYFLKNTNVEFQFNDAKRDVYFWRTGYLLLTKSFLTNEIHQ